ncbi:cold shock domain-containing protein [Paenibacillus sp. J5C_2022]|uniref:cold-shock protein n=1 Tax=Paenibacillus sp. J5C2022 TaxID=2977129 RepID=UPI0021CEFB12|nr:cold shock domain-containing protein [Paenibacillus sp. J5C2022]MCU6709783.1 cold shock domain-containing protein [Paenibacillus sp. J5C2022]
MYNESATWTTYRAEDTEAHVELMASIGPSIGTSKRQPKPERKGPEYQPVSPSKHVGKVRFFNPDKGFGFIGLNGGKPGKLFFHVAEIVDGNKAYIREGVTVAYEEGVDRQGRTKAVAVQLVNV